MRNKRSYIFHIQRATVGGRREGAGNMVDGGDAWLVTELMRGKEHRMRGELVRIVK